ncbi:MAG TPA: MarR family winged helix-turn-helix transcriptional regulator [Streptosporangiaceae bacterium]|nr:MarR family winged helix-turn-helix transcriptional regulator [Streptosporangiaceae bacterium]
MPDPDAPRPRSGDPGGGAAASAEAAASPDLGSGELGSGGLAGPAADIHGSFDRAANIFGALSLVIADRAADAVAEATGRSESAAAALSALLHFLDRPSVELLRQVLGLTPSGTVRLVDRLEQAGYVRRGTGMDRRTTALTLTEQGRRAAMAVSEARAAVLAGALAGLDQAERETFEQLAAKVLVGMMRGPGAVRWICRLCDIGVCRGTEGGCPLGNAARRRYAP